MADFVQNHARTFREMYAANYNGFAFDPNPVRSL